MRNKLILLGIAIILMLTSAISVYANTETTLTMSVDKNEVKAGETFTVTLKATCPDGINGIVTTYSYDENKLEYVSENVVDSNYAFGGNKDAKEIFVYCTSTDSIQNADVYALTFKVKAGAEVNTYAKISLAETTLDSDAATNSEHTLQSQEISVKIVNTTENEEGEDPEPPVTDGEGEDPEPPVTDGEGEDPEPPATDGEGEDPEPPATDGEGEDPEPPATDGEGEDPEPPATDGEGEDPEPPATDGKGEEPKPPVKDNKDETITDKNYNKAGFNPTILISIVITVTIAFVMYLKNKKYEDIR